MRMKVPCPHLTPPALAPPFLGLLENPPKKTIRHSAAKDRMTWPRVEKMNGVFLSARLTGIYTTWFVLLSEEKEKKCWKAIDRQTRTMTTIKTALNLIDRLSAFVGFDGAGFFSMTNKTSRTLKVTSQAYTMLRNKKEASSRKGSINVASSCVV